MARIKAKSWINSLTWSLEVIWDQLLLSTIYLPVQVLVLLKRKL